MPQSEIEAVTADWAQKFNARDAARLASLYDESAVLWGTFAPNLTVSPQGVRAYFDAVCALPAPLRVEFDEQLIRSCGDTVLNAGRYTFTFVDNAQPPIEARFSMVFRHVGERWLIIDHHSSQRPAAVAARE